MAEISTIEWIWKRKYFSITKKGVRGNNVQKCKTFSQTKIHSFFFFDVVVVVVVVEIFSHESWWLKLSQNMKELLQQKSTLWVHYCKTSKAGFIVGKGALAYWL